MKFWTKWKLISYIIIQNFHTNIEYNNTHTTVGICFRHDNNTKSTIETLRKIENHPNPLMHQPNKLLLKKIKERKVNCLMVKELLLTKISFNRHILIADLVEPQGSN